MCLSRTLRSGQQSAPRSSTEERCPGGLGPIPQTIPTTPKICGLLSKTCQRGSQPDTSFQLQEVREGGGGAGILGFNKCPRGMRGPDKVGPHKRDSPEPLREFPGSVFVVNGNKTLQT